jgi:hypothetical protein
VSVNAVISIVGRRSYGVNIWCAPIADDSTSHVWCRKAECTSKGTGGSSDPNSPHGVPGCKRVRPVVKIRTRADGTRHEHDLCFRKAMVTKRAGVCIRELHPILIIQGLPTFAMGVVDPSTPTYAGTSPTKATSVCVEIRPSIIDVKTRRLDRNAEKVLGPRW